MAEEGMSERQRNRLAVSVWDLAEARMFIGFYHKAEPRGDGLAMRMACMVAATVTYARPFSQNYGADAEPKLDEQWVNETAALTEHERKIHTNVMAYRNKVVAHSDYETRPGYVTDATDDGSPRELVLKIYNYAEPQWFDPGEFAELVDKVLKACEDTVRS